MLSPQSGAESFAGLASQQWVTFQPTYLLSAPLWGLSVGCGEGNAGEEKAAPLEGLPAAGCVRG